MSNDDKKESYADFVRRSQPVASDEDVARSIKRVTRDHGDLIRGLASSEAQSEDGNRIERVEQVEDAYDSRDGVRDANLQGDRRGGGEAREGVQREQQDSGVARGDEPFGGVVGPASTEVAAPRSGGDAQASTTYQVTGASGSLERADMILGWHTNAARRGIAGLIEELGRRSEATCVLHEKIANLEADLSDAWTLIEKNERLSVEVFELRAALVRKDSKGRPAATGAIATLADRGPESATTTPRTADAPNHREWIDAGYARVRERAQPDLGDPTDLGLPGRGDTPDPTPRERLMAYDERAVVLLTTFLSFYAKAPNRARAVVLEMIEEGHIAIDSEGNIKRLRREDPPCETSSSSASAASPPPSSGNSCASSAGAVPNASPVRDVHMRLTYIVDENLGTRETMPTESLLTILEEELPKAMRELEDLRDGKELHEEEVEQLRTALTRIHRGEQPMHMIAADALWGEAKPAAAPSSSVADPSEVIAAVREIMQHGPTPREMYRLRHAWDRFEAAGQFTRVSEEKKP